MAEAVGGGTSSEYSASVTGSCASGRGRNAEMARQAIHAQPSAEAMAAATAAASNESDEDVLLLRAVHVLRPAGDLRV